MLPNNTNFTPLAFMRPLMGKCYCNDFYDRLEVYRYFMRPRLVAFRHDDGSWHIRRKYRLIYSEKFVVKIADKYLASKLNRP
ncbi:MAG: hypothetical protein PHQ27_06245 [Victivallales bacterium]|nr:hypothetical protein [Victivallales bacterium]